MRTMLERCRKTAMVLSGVLLALFAVPAIAEEPAIEGTGLARDAKFGGEQTMVGYECDGCELDWRDGLPYATGRDGTPENFTVVATAPASERNAGGWLLRST